MASPEAIKEELDEIDDVWKQARFDSLPHVVKILTSEDPEDAIQILRERHDAIEDLVDDVVHAYHNGFNKAIHNYSQILKLFGESSGKINGLKQNLTEAKGLVGSRNKHLQQLSYRSVTVRHIISLLDQIENVAKVTARIDKLIAKKRYYAAVQLYLQSTSLLEREGIQGVGALMDVRSDLSKLRGILFFKVVEELHLHVYNKGEYSGNSTMIDDKDDDDIFDIPITNLFASRNNQPISRRTPTKKRGDQQVDKFHRLGSIDGSSSADGRDDESSVTGEIESTHSITNGKDPSIDDSSRGSKGLPVWLEDSNPNEFTELMAKSNAPVNVKYLHTMVECLALLGKIAAAGAIMSQRLRPTIHDIITSDVKDRAMAIDAQRPRVDQVSKRASVGFSFSQANGGSPWRENTKVVPSAVGPVAPSLGPTGRGQVAARELLESILSLVIQILGNHVIVGEMMESKSESQDDPNSPKKVNGDPSWGADPDVARATGGYSLSSALVVLQSECQQLICDILRATPDAATADAAVQTARLASKIPSKESSMNGASEEGLSFAFRFTDTALAHPGGDALRQVRKGRNTAVSQEGYGTGAVLSERGIYLTPAVYRPVLQFTDKVTLLLPPKYSQLGKDGLQSFMENFVKDQFMPLVRVDYRTRVQEALATAAAFRPKARIGANYQLSLEKGRPLLQGPLAAGYLANEVVGWAQAMPKYAGDFVEVAHALLERTLERCRASYTEAVLGSLSSSLVGRMEVENLMKQESASRLLDATYFAQLGKNVSLDQLLDAESLEVEMEINNLLLSLRPIKQEQLIGDGHKLILLAALSDSLEYLAETIEKLGQATTLSSPYKKTESRPTPQQHHRRTSSALTSSLAALVDKYNLLSSECMRTLRVEMQLKAIYYLQAMSTRTYLTDQDAEEPEDFILSLTSQITRIDEEITPYVPLLRRSYVFGGVCNVAAASFIKAVNEMESINLFGVRQVCRNCIALEQALAALPSSDSNSVRHHLDRVQQFYELLNLPFEALLAFVADHEQRFSFSEFSSLLKVDVPGRDMPLDAIQQIGKILAPNY